VLLSVAAGVRILPVGGLIRKLARLSAAEQEDPAAVPARDRSPGRRRPRRYLARPSARFLAARPRRAGDGDRRAPNVAAITAAYALIKRVSLGYARRHFRILVSMTRRVSEARAIYDNMARVTASHRLARLDYAGCVPVDERLRQASRLGQPVAGLFPDSPAASAYQTLGNELLKWPAGEGAAGGLEPFVQQLLQLSQHIEPTAIYA
jgi:flagellar biosynthesis protein FlhG